MWPVNCRQQGCQHDNHGKRAQMSQNERKPSTPAVTIPLPQESFRDRLKRITEDPDLLDVICGHISNGGTIIQLAKTWDVPASSVFNWIRKDAERTKRYEQALVDRKEWLVERLHQEMHALSVSDVRSIYDEQGRLLPVNQWPESVSVAVQSVESQELFDSDQVQVGVTRRVKFWDKNKSLEQLAKLHKLLTDTVEHTGQVTLADLILASYKVNEAVEPAAVQLSSNQIPNVTERPVGGTLTNVTERDRTDSGTIKHETEN
jgi:hypothetical protein